MSGRGGSSSNGGGEQAIPSASRKMVQSLKEIVNCPEPEIYAMLKECNMDPNEAVNRLLSLDPFHEVKSKREKKKENKDTTESRSRGVSNTSTRVGRVGTDRYAGRGGLTQFSSFESDALHSKPAYKKENGTNNYTSPSAAALGMPGINMNLRGAVQSGLVTTENKVTTIGAVDGTLSSSWPSSVHQPAWSGVPGQVSMADIVKMGRSHGKASSTANPPQHGVNQHHVQASQFNVSHHVSCSFEDHASKVSEYNGEPVVGIGHLVSPCDDWPLVEQPPAASVPLVLEPPGASDLDVEASNLFSDVINQHPQSPKDEVQAVEDAAIECSNANHAGSASAARRKIQDNSGGDFLFDNSIYERAGSYQPHKSAYEHQEGDDVGVLVSSVTSNLQQLSVQEDWGTPPEDDHPAVIIPSHLQVQNADCSHLSFGSFGADISTALSRPFSSGPLQSSIEVASADSGVSSIGRLNTRNPEYYTDERTPSDGNLVHRTGASAGSYDSPSSSQPQVLKQETTEALHENQYTFPSSASSYDFDNGHQLNAACPHSQTNSHIQNLAPFSSVMQAYTNSLPSSLLAVGVQPVRESDLPYSPFPMAQTMPTKYGNAASSISIPEALKTVGFSSSQPTAQTLTGSSIATGPALPQHLTHVHPYSQTAVPLGPYANMISYPFMPQSYTYLPPAFQQAYAGNSTYHQSLAAVLPQYKNNVSVSSLPQSAAIASGYSGFGGSTSNFPMNPTVAPGAATMGYDDVMTSQYKDSNHLISLQQNENSAMWVHGLGSRTMSPVPASTYYSIQGSSQPSSGYRQTQQPSESYGALNYQNLYHSQTGMSLENPRDGHLGGSQAQSSKQSQQMWQNSY